MKFIFYAPEYSEESGGIAAQYFLAAKLVELGHTVKIWPYERPRSTFSFSFGALVFRRLLTLRWKKLWRTVTWYRKKTPPFHMEYAHKSLDLQDWVVVYTETVVGNPLRAKHVVRWILYHPGAFSKKRIRFESNALFFHWDLAFGTAATLGSRRVLRLGLF